VRKRKVDVSLTTFCYYYLNSLSHSTPLHSFILLSHSTFLDLALFALLGVFKVALVTQLHHVSRLVDFALETTESTLDRFTISHIDPNLDWKSSRRDLLLH